MRIGMLGATGPAGRGIGGAAERASGTTCCSGRARVDKAEAVRRRAERALGRPRRSRLTPVDNQAACDAPVVILAVHADSAIATVKELADQLAGKIVVSMANNLVRNGTEFNAVLPPHGSVAEEIQALLWRSRVVTAFHLVPAAEFDDLDHEMESDVVRARRRRRRPRHAHGDHRQHPGPARRSTAARCATPSAWRPSRPVLLTVNIRHKMRASLASRV